MPYQNNQPLGSSVRGGGGGWRALSFMNSMKADAKGKPSDNQTQAMKAGAGPVSEAGAKDFLAQQARMNSILGLGSNTVTGSVNQIASPYIGKGYTAGTGQTQAKGSSY